MARYKVSYSGFAYVKADNEDEARELFEDEDFVYSEEEITEVEEVDDFWVTLW